MNTLYLKKRNVLLVLAGLFILIGMTSEVQAQVATTQHWTGITPPPPNGTSYTLGQVTGGTWDATANWANAGTNTITDFYALTTGAGRVANFQPTTGGYTVTIADGHTVPVIRALQASGGANAAVTIASGTAKTIQLATASGAYINIAAGKELIIGPNVAIGLFGTGTQSFSKLSPGTLRWSGSATAYNAGIQVSAGTFIIDSDASSRLGAGATVNIAGGEFRYNGASALNSAVSLTSGKISGAGRIASAVSVGAGSTIAPGNNAIGTQQYDDLTFASSGIYQWEIGSWLGEIAGINFDQIQADSFAVTSTLANPFVISLVSVGGALSDFNASTNRSWTLLESIATISSGVLTNLAVDSTAFAALNPLDDGVFSLAVDDKSLNLVFTAVPEPSSTLLIGLAFAAFAGMRRRMVRR